MRILNRSLHLKLPELALLLAFAMFVGCMITSAMYYEFVAVRIQACSNQ